MIQQALFEDISSKREKAIVNVASVRQLSPFRYPGGKTRLIPEIKNGYWKNLKDLNTS